MILTIAGLGFPALTRAGDGVFSDNRSGSEWRPVFATGLDAFTHTYGLAASDTTESLTEYMFSAALSGRSARRQRHRWSLLAEGSAGSELFRERLEVQYRRQDDRHRSRLRLDGMLRARQYRRTTGYSHSSGNGEGRLEARVYPWSGRGAILEARGWAGFLAYRDPSPLEVDQRDRGAGIFAHSPVSSAALWSAGLRWAGRAYPDSAAIDRRTLGLEVSYDRQDLSGQGLRLFHRTERRRVQDETVRPAAWSHWTDLEGRVQAGQGLVFLDLQAEVWSYDQDFSAYFDSRRVRSVAGYRWGDVLATQWQLGLAAEKLWASDSPEAYSQLGLRAGGEACGGSLSGSLVLEVGRRFYADGALAASSDIWSDSLLDGEESALYSDFTYWELWVTADWRLATAWSLDLMAAYEPESHTEQDDDTVLGLLTVRLSYRP